jgi:hypothetical protein
MGTQASKWDQMGYHALVWAVNEETTNKWLKNTVKTKNFLALQ